MRKDTIAPEYPGTVPGFDIPTFTGVLRMYFDQNGKGDPIAKYWNEGTREAYIRDYEKRLLPHLPIEKSLEAYEEEDFTEALALVKKENPGYTDHTIDHYRYLIWRVYQAGLDNNLYDDKLFWGVTGQTGSHSASEIKQTQTRELTRKSLSIGEEMKLLDWFKALDPCAADGRLVGLAIMFFMGLRNNEACGLNYGDVRILSSQNPFPCLYVTKTTSLTSNKLKAGGKTRNAARILPVFVFLYDFLSKRQCHIQKLISDGSLRCPEGIESANGFPIACKGDQLGVRASASDLTDTGKSLFKEMGIIDAIRSSAIHETMFKQKLADEDIGEKEPTTYLFRRNCATHLYLLGLSASEIQYFIGHEVEDSEECRNFFTNEDRLADIAQVLTEHPFVVYYQETRPKKTVAIPRHCNGFHIRVVADEPGDAIVISREGTASIPVEVTAGCIVNPEGLARKVNIRKRIDEVYLWHKEAVHE